MPAKARQSNLTWDYERWSDKLFDRAAAQAVMWAVRTSAMSDTRRRRWPGHFAIAPPPGGALLGGTHDRRVNARRSSPEAARVCGVGDLPAGDAAPTRRWGRTSPPHLDAERSELAGEVSSIRRLRDAMVGVTFGLYPAEGRRAVGCDGREEDNAACAKTKTPQQAADDLGGGGGGGGGGRRARAALMRRLGMVR